MPLSTVFRELSTVWSGKRCLVTNFKALYTGNDPMSGRWGQQG